MEATVFSMSVPQKYIPSKEKTLKQNHKHYD